LSPALADFLDSSAMMNADDVVVERSRTLTRAAVYAIESTPISPRFAIPRRQSAVREEIDLFFQIHVLISRLHLCTENVVVSRVLRVFRKRRPPAVFSRHLLRLPSGVEKQIEHLPAVSSRTRPSVTAIAAARVQNRNAGSSDSRSEARIHAVGSSSHAFRSSSRGSFSVHTAL
jgi:hypothetical protein